MEFVMLNLLHPEARELFVDYASEESGLCTTEIRVKIASCIFLDGVFIHAAVYDEIILREPDDEVKCEKVVLIGRGIAYPVIFSWPWWGFVRTILPDKIKSWIVIIKSDQRETLKINLREIFGKAAV